MKISNESLSINAQINKRFLSFSFAINDAFNKGAAILFISFLGLRGNKGIILLSNGKPKLFLEDSIFGVLDKRSANGVELQLNAQAGQIDNQVVRTVRVQLVGDGAAPVQVTITVQTNTDVNSGSSFGEGG